MGILIARDNNVNNNISYSQDNGLPTSGRQPHLVQQLSPRSVRLLWSSITGSARPRGVRSARVVVVLIPALAKQLPAVTIPVV